MGDRPDFEMARKVMRNFLAERFQLKTHEENKEMQAYALVQGKGGSKMKPADSASPGPRMRMGRGQLSGSGISMEMLTRQLGQNVGRNVIDKTALKGNYDIELNFVPEVGQGGPLPPSADAIAGAGGNGPTIFTAVQEQLGLKLEAIKAPVATLVIDSVAKPSEN